MKKWMNILWMSFLLFIIAPLTADAAQGNKNLTVDGNQVAVSVDIPEGKTGVVTSLRMQLKVSISSGTMNAPTFAFNSAVKSEIKDAAILSQEDGTYLVDLILSGKKDKDIFGDNTSLKLGTLTVNATSEEFKVKVAVAGDLDGSGTPAVKYMDANGITAMTASLPNAEDVLVDTQHKMFRETPKLKASVKNGSKSVSFSWEKIDGADGYEIYEVNGDKVTKVKDASASATTASANFGYATTHSFKIRAFMQKEDGSRAYGKYSNGVNIVVGPDKVKEFSPQYKDKSKTTLTWKKTSGASGYKIYRSAKKNGKYTQVKDIKKGQTTACTLNHPSGKTYYYKIKAYIKNPGQTVYGGLSTAKAGKTKAPQLKVSVSSKVVSLKWAKVPRSAGYKIYRSKTKSGKYKVVKTIKNASTVRYAETMPSGSKTWYYKICAFEKQKNKNINGNYSTVVKAKAK